MSSTATRLLPAALLFSSLALIGCNAHHAPVVPLSPLESAAQHHRVLVGMDKGQVRRAWDDPCEKHESSTAEGTMEAWVYCAMCATSQSVMNSLTKAHEPITCDHQRTVTFGVDGKVSEVRQ